MLTLKVLIECPDDDRIAFAETLREVARDVERGFSNECGGIECGGIGPRNLRFDYDITFGGLDEVNDAIHRGPQRLERAVAPHWIPEDEPC